MESEGRKSSLLLLTVAAAALTTTAACWNLPTRFQDTIIYSAVPGALFLVVLAVVAIVTSWNMRKLRKALTQFERSCHTCGADLHGSHELCPECGTPVDQDEALAQVPAGDGAGVVAGEPPDQTPQS